MKARDIIPDWPRSRSTIRAFDRTIDLHHRMNWYAYMLYQSAGETLIRRAECVADLKEELVLERAYRAEQQAMVTAYLTGEQAFSEYMWRNGCWLTAEILTHSLVLWRG